MTNPLLTGALALALASTSGWAGEGDDAPTLMNAAKELEFELGRRTVTGEKVESRLRPALLFALNDWAPLAREHGLAVVVCEEADCLLLGTVDRDELRDVAAQVDETHELFEELLEEAAERDAQPAPRAAVGVVFDREGFEGDAWDAVLELLVERRWLAASTAEHYAREPGPLTMRRDLVFLQSAVDLAGDASAGDDEFRLGNEVVHKYAQALVRRHFGQVPEPIRYGLGYVAEQRLFESSYLFGASGFVSSESHFGWAAAVEDALDDVDRDWTPVSALLDADAAGSAEASQKIAWAALDRLLDKDPDVLCALLTELAALHAADDPADRAMTYVGDPAEAAAILTRHCEDLDRRTLAKHAKRLK